MKAPVREIDFGSPEYAISIALRDRILRQPLGLYFSPEQLAQEAQEFHLGYWEGNQLLGCLVLKPLDAYVVKMRQVAVAENQQNKGIGTALVAFAEEFAREHLFRKMVLHARETAVDFYLQKGYTLVGEPFTEVSIPHRAMEKSLRSF